MSDIQEQIKLAYKRAEENDIKLLKEENKRLKEKIEHLLIDLDGESEYKLRNEKAIEYINVINENTPSSTRKDYAKMILINYEDLLNKLQGVDKE